MRAVFAAPERRAGQAGAELCRRARRVSGASQPIDQAGLHNRDAKSDMRDVRWPSICIACNAPATGTDLIQIGVTRISGPTKIGLRLGFSLSAVREPSYQRRAD